MSGVKTQVEREISAIQAKSLDQLRMVMDLSWLKRKDYRVVQSIEELAEYVREMGKCRLIAVDTETTGLNICNLRRNNPLKDKLVGICISWKRNFGIYIPFEHTRFNNVDKRLALRMLKPILEQKDIITHNGLFDGKVFYDEGIRLNIKQDTMLLYFNIDSTVSKGSKGLKNLTEKRYNYSVIELGDIFAKADDHGLFMYLPMDLVAAYACADADHTLQLFLDSFKMLTPGQRRSYALDIVTQNELIRSEYYGKGINMDLLKQLHDVTVKDQEMLQDIIFRYAHYLICKENGFPHSEAKYQFQLTSNDDLAELFHTLLKYPVKKRNEETGKISVDKFVIKALLKEESNEFDEFEEKLFSDDIKSCIGEFATEPVSEKDLVLIKQKELKKYKYKLPALVKAWRKLEKDRSSFYAPLLNNNYEGKYFSSISMTRTSTARLIDNIQTLAGYLKKLIIPFDPENQYLIDFDFAQIEYRCMTGQAGISWLAERLNNPEADYHREGGSLILNKPPQDITGAERKSLKSINFGIPYGMSDVGIMESRYGIDLTEEERAKYLAQTRDLLQRWHKGLYQISDMLNDYRKKSVQAIPRAQLPDYFKNRTIGRISNLLGRTRVFDLDPADGQELSKSEIASIQRQAGNFPIQSFAAEIYRVAFTRLCEKFKEMGWMDKRIPSKDTAIGEEFTNSVTIIAYIHDECLMVVDKSIDPFMIEKLIYEACMLELPGHPRYYCGINVITNWYEGKDDKFEAPPAFVKEMKDLIDAGGSTGYTVSCNPRDFVLDKITEWIDKRVKAEMMKVSPTTYENHILDLRDALPKFTDYFVKPKMEAFYGIGRKTRSGVPFDDFSAVLLETYFSKTIGPLDVIYPDGSVAHIEYKDEEVILLPIEKESEVERTILCEALEEATDDDMTFTVNGSTLERDREGLEMIDMSMFFAEFAKVYSDLGRDICDTH